RFSASSFDVTISDSSGTRAISLSLFNWASCCSVGFSMAGFSSHENAAPVSPVPLNPEQPWHARELRTRKRAAAVHPRRDPLLTLSTMGIPNLSTSPTFLSAQASSSLVGPLALAHARLQPWSDQRAALLI